MLNKLGTFELAISEPIQNKKEEEEEDTCNQMLFWLFREQNGQLYVNAKF